MRVVAIFAFIFDVRRRNGNAAGFFLGRLVDLVKGHIVGFAFGCQNLRHGRRKGRLAMIHVTDRPNVDVRLAALEFRLRH